MAKRPSPRALRKAMDEMEVPEAYRPRDPELTGGRPRRRPRPTEPAALALLCQRLVGGLSMSDACLDPRCPGETEVYQEMAVNQSFYGTIARAREAQQHVIIDSTIKMADEATVEDWQVVRMRIWARQWRAGKLAPKTYGDKIDVNHGGLVGTVALPYDPTALTPEQREVMRDVLLTAPKTIDGKAE